MNRSETIGHKNFRNVSTFNSKKVLNHFHGLRILHLVLEVRFYCYVLSQFLFSLIIVGNDAGHFSVKSFLVVEMGEMNVFMDDNELCNSWGKSNELPVEYY